MSENTQNDGSESKEQKMKPIVSFFAGREIFEHFSHQQLRPLMEKLSETEPYPDIFAGDKRANVRDKLLPLQIRMEQARGRLGGCLGEIFVIPTTCSLGTAKNPCRTSRLACYGYTPLLVAWPTKIII